MALRAWCFTINNPSFDVLSLPHPDHVRYMVWQREKGEEGTVHVQGYAEFARPVRMAAIKRAWPTAHLEPRMGTRDQARDYCMKQDTRDAGDDAGPHEHGSWEAGGSGKRNDVAAARDFIMGGGSKRQVFEQYPEVVAKYPRFVAQALAYAQADALPKQDLPNPRPFQEKVLEMVASEPDERQVLWCVDRVGGAGKTTLARYLVDNHGAFYSNGGKHADVTYAYAGEKIVVFDYVRDSEPYVNYGVIEAIKNGILYSPKYESGMKRFSTPHVIIFANFFPDTSKMSSDRWVIVKLTEAGDYEMA